MKLLGSAVKPEPLARFWAVGMAHVALGLWAWEPLSTEDNEGYHSLMLMYGKCLSNVGS